MSATSGSHSRGDTPRDTVDATMPEVVDAGRRLESVALLSQEGRFDFDASEEAWEGRE